MKRQKLLYTTTLSNFLLTSEKLFREHTIHILKFILIMIIASFLLGSSKFEKKAYGCDHNQIGNTTTANNGEWTLTGFTDDDKYQVGYISSASLSSLQTDTQSTDNLSEVQFTSAINRNGDFGVNTADAFVDPINPLSNYTGLLNSGMVIITCSSSKEGNVSSTAIGS